jgi:hypothetical protein
MERRRNIFFIASPYYNSFIRRRETNDNSLNLKIKNLQKKLDKPLSEKVKELSIMY